MTLKERFSSAEKTGEKVKWTVIDETRQIHSVTGTWWWSKSFGEATYETKLNGKSYGGTSFSGDDGTWGARNGTLDGNEPLSRSGFWGVGVFAGTDDECTDVHLSDKVLRNPNPDAPPQTYMYMGGLRDYSSYNVEQLEYFDKDICVPRTASTSTTAASTTTTTTSCARPDADVVFLIDASYSVANLKFKGCGSFTTSINNFTDRIIDRFRARGYFTNNNETGMHVAAVTYKNLANVGFDFKNDPTEIKKALNNLDLNGNVAATYAYRGFEVVGEQLLATGKHGFRGFATTPVVIIVISDGKSHFEDNVGNGASSDSLDKALAHININRDSVDRVVLDIFETPNRGLYEKMASNASNVLALHCAADGALSQQVAGENVADTDAVSDRILDDAAEKIAEHVQNLYPCHRLDPCSARADVVFVIDASTSIVDDEFCSNRNGTEFQLLTDFAARAVERLSANIDDGLVRVGAVTFATQSEKVLALTNSGTAADISSKLRKLEPPSRYGPAGLFQLETTSNMHLGLEQARGLVVDAERTAHPQRAVHIVVVSDFIPRNKNASDPCPKGTEKDNFYKYENCIMAKGVAALRSELDASVDFYSGDDVNRWAYDLGCESTINTQVNNVSQKVVGMVALDANKHGKVYDAAAAVEFAAAVLDRRVCPSTSSTSTTTTATTTTTTTTTTSTTTSTTTTATTTTSTTTTTTTTTCMRQDADVIFLIDASSSVVNLKFKGCGAFTTPINEFTDRIIERFDQNGYFTNEDDGMHVAAVTYKNIANIGFSFQKNADTIKQALRDLDLDGKVAATYAHRGFEVIGENLLNSSKYGFRGFNRVPVVIVVISDGKSHFEDVVGSDGSRNLLQDALNHPNINNDKVYRVALEIFDTENKYLYNQMASSPRDVLRLHCDVGGVAAQQGANLIGPALPGSTCKT